MFRPVDPAPRPDRRSSLRGKFAVTSMPMANRIAGQRAVRRHLRAAPAQQPGLLDSRQCRDNSMFAPALSKPGIDCSRVQSEADTKPTRVPASEQSIVARTRISAPRHSVPHFAKKLAASQSPLPMACFCAAVAYGGECPHRRRAMHRLPPCGRRRRAGWDLHRETGSAGL